MFGSLKLLHWVKKMSTGSLNFPCWISGYSFSLLSLSVVWCHYFCIVIAEANLCQRSCFLHSRELFTYLYRVNIHTSDECTLILRLINTISNERSWVDIMGRVGVFALLDHTNSLELDFVWMISDEWILTSIYYPLSQHHANNFSKLRDDQDFKSLNHWRSTLFHLHSMIITWN